jgi:predicted RNase H-like nuclease
MVTALVQFPLPASVTREAAIGLFKGSAPRYRDMPGLIRKYYVLGEDGRGGGIYLWKSREAAERVYDAVWRTMIKERYGAEPVITYFDTPVIVDNTTGEISVDARAGSRRHVRRGLRRPS